ncbi:hypothetical protein [Fictibacillus phosphorivorans]|uniref:hypothetical protein n=1 Tax=Fictibacillus phosphorivorans TaxID=1221500 RepID=UPI002042467B|nr:hypothetical protein [Fictibacillus phosphorivorans]MCM3719500.1 hypothetical protein [Fictibacillus phosphorivorans]MCM3777191.1 hypothetical protein [Fictibacillus phosphorivorans]
MFIHYVVAALVYILLLVFAYAVMIFINMGEDKSEKIITSSFYRAYTVLLFGMLLVYTIVIHPHTDLDHQTTSLLILISKFISVLTLGGSLYLMTKKGFKRLR